MSYSYDTRKKPAEQTAERDTAPEQTTTLKGGVSGAAAEGSGRADLPEAMRARMADTFGDSLSDAREHGERARGGFLTGHAPEVQAEHTANAGQGVYSGPVTGAMSAAAPAVSTAGPMQAKRKSAEEKQQDRVRRQRIREDDAALAQQQAEGAALAEQRREAGNIEMIHDDRTWGEEHWGLGKRLKNWWSLKNSTGLSNRKSKVQERMEADMAWNKAKPSQLPDYDAEIDAEAEEDLDDEDNEVYD